MGQVVQVILCHPTNKNTPCCLYLSWVDQWRVSLSRTHLGSRKTHPRLSHGSRWTLWTWLPLAKTRSRLMNQRLSFTQSEQLLLASRGVTLAPAIPLPGGPVAPGGPIIPGSPWKRKHVTQTFELNAVILNDLITNIYKKPLAPLAPQDQLRLAGLWSPCPLCLPTGHQNNTGTNIFSIVLVKSEITAYLTNINI